MTLLAARRLRKTFVRADGGRVAALDGVSLDLAFEETFGLVGASGSGKTTLVRCLARLEEPDGGTVVFDGLDWLALRGRARRRASGRLQVVFQDPYASLNPTMKVSAIVEEPLVIQRQGGRAARRERVCRMLGRVGLDPDLWARFPESLSGGQRQRVAIARALVAGPKLLLADEPVTALDGPTRERILILLAELRRDLRLTTVLVGHDLDLARRFCDRIGVLYRGRIVELADTEVLVSEAVHPYTRNLLAAAAMRPGEDLAVPPPPSGDPRLVSPGHWVLM
jgi:ABC-type glutathione transport system ATPase component